MNGGRAGMVVADTEEGEMGKEKRLQVSLLLLRLGVFIVMLMWTVDKFVRPEHASAVYANFYFIEGLGHTVYVVIGAVELLVILAFVAGWKKGLTYAAVLVLHAVSTLSSYQQYLAPFEGPNLLFFAAWPMLAACIALYLLRDHDTLLSV